VTNDTTLRTKLYRNFQILFHDELPSLPLFYPVYNYGVRNTINGVSSGPVYDPSDRLKDIASWYILAGHVNPEITPTAQ